ncbi:MAG TPA: hypothetical protein VM684_21620 [Gaiellales bacterium]|nr:hypothetical protein [Gaiellales bacterium]
MEPHARSGLEAGGRDRGLLRSGRRDRRGGRGLHARGIRGLQGLSGCLGDILRRLLTGRLRGLRRGGGCVRGRLGGRGGALRSCLLHGRLGGLRLRLRLLALAGRLRVGLLVVGKNRDLSLSLSLRLLLRLAGPIGDDRLRLGLSGLHRRGDLLQHGSGRLHRHHRHLRLGVRGNHGRGIHRKLNNRLLGRTLSHRSLDRATGNRSGLLDNRGSDRQSNGGSGSQHGITVGGRSSGSVRGRSLA